MEEENMNILILIPSVPIRHFGLDPDPDPWIHLTFKMPTKNEFFLLKFFCILLFEVTFTSFFKDKKSKRSHKTVEIKVFLTIFA